MPLMKWKEMLTKLKSWSRQTCKGVKLFRWEIANYFAWFWLNLDIKYFFWIFRTKSKILRNMVWNFWIIKAKWILCWTSMEINAAISDLAAIVFLKNILNEIMKYITISLKLLHFRIISHLFFCSLWRSIILLVEFI